MIILFSVLGGRPRTSKKASSKGCSGTGTGGLSSNEGLPQSMVAFILRSEWSLLMTDQDLSRLKIDKSKVMFQPRKRRRVIYLALIVIAFIVCGILYTRGFFTPAIEVRVATVSQIYPSQTFTVLNARGYVVP